MDFAPRPATFGWDGASRRATPLQYIAAAVVMALAGWAASRGPLLLVESVHWAGRVLFSVAVALRLLVLGVSRPAPAEQTGPSPTPSYTIIVPLYREAAVVPGLMAALARLDYPRDRLQLLFALEADDVETRDAVARHMPRVAQAILAIGGPRTKPNACNAALAQASGEFVVVYDAEDRPHPGQLREAAARFALLGPQTVCLQAPLRIRRETGFLRRQFALEYAALFEVTLPALARLGLAFPLGGTSNHFRRAALQAVGGWDAYNVTEDADIGLRLGACGGRLGMLSLPTWEPAPPSLQVWSPQRTRWIKGHLQTWLVHMRRPFHGGPRAFATLQLTLGLNVATAMMHGPMALGVGACLLLAAISRSSPTLEVVDTTLLVAGWATAAAAMSVGARRADIPLHLRDLLTAPFYWPLQSMAAMFALGELAFRPHHWNKTPHDVQEDAGHADAPEAALGA